MIRPLFWFQIGRISIVGLFCSLGVLEVTARPSLRMLAFQSHLKLKVKKGFIVWKFIGTILNNFRASKTILDTDFL